MSIYVQCKDCGEEIESDEFRIDGYGDIEMKVKPCKTCLKEAKGIEDEENNE